MRQMNVAPVTMLTASRPQTSGDVQLRCGASLIAISRAARAHAINSSASTSRWRACARSSFSRGSETHATTAAMMPGSTLIKKSQCQEYVSVSQPPTTGPTVGASTAKTPAIVVATDCSRNGNRIKTAEKTAGIKVPPEKPCTMRHRINVAKLLLKAQAIDASVKAETAMTNSHRMVKARVRKPVSGIAMISAIRYEVWTQLI